MSLNIKNGNPLQRILITLSMLACVCLLAVCIFHYRHIRDVLASPHIPSTSEIVSTKQSASHIRIPKREPPQQRDPDAFYQTIIDNNIFRPLNWKPTQKAPTYILLGTIIPTDGGTATAYIQGHSSGPLHIVKLGDPLGSTTVQNITSKRVTLNTQKGDSLNLYLGGNMFLNPSRTESNRSDEHIRQTRSRTENKTTASSPKSPSPPIAQQRVYEEGVERLKNRANELRSERTRMQERLRSLEQR